MTQATGHFPGLQVSLSTFYYLAKRSALCVKDLDYDGHVLFCYYLPTCTLSKLILTDLARFQFSSATCSTSVLWYSAGKLQSPLTSCYAYYGNRNRPQMMQQLNKCSKCTPILWGTHLQPRLAQCRLTTVIRLLWYAFSGSRRDFSARVDLVLRRSSGLTLGNGHWTL